MRTTAAQRLAESSGAELAERYRDGLSVSRCAAEFGVASPTISAALRLLGITPRSPTEQRKLDHEHSARLRELLDAGMSVHDISQQLGLRPGAVHSLLRTRGWHHEAVGPMPQRAGHRLTDQQLTHLLEPEFDIAPAAALSQQFGLSPAAIAYYRRLIRRGEWFCEISWNPCPVCGQPACGKKRGKRHVHPRCRTAHTRDLQRSWNDRINPSRDRKRHWTAAEDIYLLKHQEDGDQQLAAALGRTERAVHQRLGQMRKRSRFTTTCLICGQPILSNAPNTQTHPGACRRERDRQLAAESRARRRERGLTSTEYVRKWRAEHPDLVAERRRQAAPQHREYIRAYRAEHPEENEIRLDALAEATRQSQERTLKHNRSHGAAWTNDEDRQLIEWDGDETHEELAIRLGRTLTAVRTRRYWLRKRGFID